MEHSTQDNSSEINSLEELKSQRLQPDDSLWSDIKADAIANGGKPSPQRFVRLLLLHSGFQLLILFRLQKHLRLWGSFGQFWGDVLLKFAKDLTGCHLYHDAELEGGIHLPHATGIVIGKGVIVRQGVTIYHNVTLGRRTNAQGDYPELCQGCTIYAGVQILGKVIIGKNAVVGANAVVLNSIPDQATAVGIPAKIINSDNP